MKIIQIYHDEERIKLPQEDAWAIDEKKGIFAVADGVHLLEGIEYVRGGAYPDPSPSGKIASEFCKSFLKYGARGDIKKAFSLANHFVFAINKDRDRSQTFSKATAYYAATAAFGRLKKDVFEWGHICDSGIMIIGRDGEIVLCSIDHKHHNEFDPVLDMYSALDRSYMLRTVFKNALFSTGKKIGYGVVTGEKSAEPYVIYGKRKLKKGEVAVLTTDGFEFYLQEKSFRKAILTMDKTVIEKVMGEIAEKHKRAGDFISERTLIAVSVE